MAPFAAMLPMVMLPTMAMAVRPALAAFALFTFCAVAALTGGAAAFAGLGLLRFPGL